MTSRSPCPSAALAALAARRLAALIDGDEADEEPVVLPSRIVHRATCGCAAPGTKLEETL